MEDSTKGERREKKRRSQRKMKVTGASTRLIQRVIEERAKRLSQKPDTQPGDGKQA